ncbi:MAG: HlyC/CorC family transporter [bacterium]|nr:HlyC/CorC family transporter [bacterium]
MDVHNVSIYQVLIIVLCTILSAFFSGSETALFSLKKPDLHRFSLSGKKKEQSIASAMSQPQNILITILIGNLFVNLVISNISARLLLLQWKDWGHVISIAIVTPIIVILCEIAPKLISIHSYNSVAGKVFPLLNLFHKLFFPIRVAILFCIDIVIKIFRLKVETESITADELGAAVSTGEEEGFIDKGEGKIIKNVIRFSRKEASNVMFPRNRAVFIPYGASVDEAMTIFMESDVIRAPVYKDDLDTVVGMIDSKELLPYFLGYKKAKSINKFIREIAFFPESRELHDLLNDFLDSGLQIAIVVDEFGGTAGVVSLNVILGELMGKEFSKWKADKKTEIRQVDEHVSVIRGEMQIDDFNHMFEAHLSSSNSETIGGYVIETLGYFPKRGEAIVVEEFILRIKYVQKNRIVTIEVIK